MALPYLTLEGFRVRTLLGVGEVDFVEADSPGFTAARIAIHTSWMHQRLRKRYGASLPFGSKGPVPEIILGWLCALVALDVMRKRGMNPSDPIAEMLTGDAARALEEIKEAADSEKGLFDLASVGEPDGGSNVTTGGPLFYSEGSPYVNQDKQAIQGRREDSGRNGSGDG